MTRPKLKPKFKPRQKTFAKPELPFKSRVTKGKHKPKEPHWTDEPVRDQEVKFRSSLKVTAHSPRTGIVKSRSKHEAQPLIVFSEEVRRHADYLEKTIGPAERDKFLNKVKEELQKEGEKSGMAVGHTYIAEQMNRSQQQQRQFGFGANKNISMMVEQQYATELSAIDDEIERLHARKQQLSQGLALIRQATAILTGESKVRTQPVRKNAGAPHDGVSKAVHGFWVNHIYDVMQKHGPMSKRELTKKLREIRPTGYSGSVVNMLKDGRLIEDKDADLVSVGRWPDKQPEAPLESQEPASQLAV